MVPVFQRRENLPFVALSFILILIVALALATFGVRPTTAQPNARQVEPTAIIDATIQDLSQRLGKTFSRGTVDNWTWEEDIFPDAGLGCPQPGQTYPAGQLHGYKIDITINGTVYDYRARKDNGVFFLCSPSADSIRPISAATARPATITPQPSAIPIVTNPPNGSPIPTGTSGLSNGNVGSRTEVAYIAPDGNVRVVTFGIGGTNVALTTDATVQINVRNALDQTLNNARSYGYLRWSPDGSKLLFVEFSTRTIYVALSGQQPQAVVSDYGLSRDSAFPPAWSPDGTQIAYVAHKPDGPSPAGQLLTLTLNAGQAPTLITDVSCGGTSNQSLQLDEAAAYREINRENFKNPAFLGWAGINILYGGCGEVGAVDVASKTSRWKAQGLSRLAMSPDAKHLAALTTATPPQLVLVDLSNGAPAALPGVPGTIDQVTWLGDGQNLVFSTAAPGINLAGDPNNAIGKQSVPGWPLIGRSRILDLWSIPASGGTPTKLFEAEGYQIGLIATNAHDAGIAFSRITSLRTLVQTVNTATQTTNLDPALPHPEITYLPPIVAGSSNTATNVGAGGQPAASFGSFLPFGASVAPTPTALSLVQSGPTSTLSIQVVASSNGQCPGAPPSRLAVGGTGKVTPGDPNLLRDQAGGSRTLGVIPAGATFSVLEGPLCASNGIAWWQVNYNGLIGWTAEGQGSTYYLSP